MFLLKLMFVLGLCLMVDSAIPGGVTQLSGKELKDAEDILKNSLTKLVSGNGPTYRLRKIILATVQVVSGNKYVYKAELIEGDKTKICTVQVLSQPWLPKGTTVTLECPDGKVLKTVF